MTDPVPDNRETQLAAAVACLRAGDRVGAEAGFRAMVARNPRDWPAWSNLGVALDAQARFAEAADAYRAALAVNPVHALAQFNLGAALLKLGDRAAAIPVLRAVAANPRADAALRNRATRARLAAAVEVVDIPPPKAGDPHGALLVEALDFRTRGLRDAALDRLRRILRDAPDHAPAAYHAAQECYWAGLLDEAYGHAQVALRRTAAHWRPLATPAPPAAFDREAARRALFDLLDALAPAGPFLIGGTALGCVRDGDFICFDSDLDVGVLPGTAPEPLIEAIEAHPRLHFTGHDVFRDQVIRLRFDAQSGIHGDVFLYQQDQDGLWCGVQRGPFAMRWRETPFALAPRNFLGRDVLLPDPAERFLAENYGAWQIPDPDHIPGFSAPNLIDPDGPLIHVTVYLSIIAAMQRGDAVQVGRYCREAAARFPDDRLLALTSRALANQP